MFKLFFFCLSVFSYFFTTYIYFTYNINRQVHLHFEAAPGLGKPPGCCTAAVRPDVRAW